MTVRNLAPALALLAFTTLACDPNVVIGAKWRVGEGPIAGSAGGGSDVGGTAGGESVAEGGTSDMPPSAGGTTSGDGGTAAQAGANSSVFFEADHEDGLGAWDRGPDMDAGGYYADSSEALPHYNGDGPAHSGRGSAEVTIDTSMGTATIARLYRRIENPSAYYSAWFYLAEDHTPSQWWSIFLFRAHQDRGDSIDLWDVDLIRVDDRLTISIYDHRRGEVIEIPSQPTIPVAQWFHVEAYLEFGAAKPSRVDYWIDGKAVLSLPDLTEMPANEPVYWVIGNGGSLLTPPVSTIYVDDAIISATRVGVQ